jgi:hypothetical protein
MAKESKTTKIIAAFIPIVIVLVTITTVIIINKKKESPSPTGGSEIFPTVTGDFGSKPTISFDNTTSTPPSTLEKKILKQGSGKEVKSGQKVSVNYYGVVYGQKEPFDNSYDRGEPFDFNVGAGSVIKGWDQGLLGQKVGSRVILVIPPDLGYGEQGQPPTIPGNSTLVFVVDIISVK